MLTLKEYRIVDPAETTAARLSDVATVLQQRGITAELELRRRRIGGTAGMAGREGSFRMVIDERLRSE